MELFTKDSALRKGLASARKQLDSFSAFSRKRGMGLAASGIALMAPVVAAIPIYAQFTTQMSAVRAVTQASAEDFADLNQVAKDLGSSTSFSASQVAEGMKYLGMAGFDTKEIIAGIPSVLNLARAGALDLGIAADIASDVSSAFSMTADEIGRVSDVIAKTATSANATVEMMGETFKYVAPVAYAAGQSLEEMSTAIGLLGNNIVKATTAGTDMKEILATLAADQDKITSLGVQVSDAEGNIRPVLDIMQDLGRATQNMRPDDRLALMMDIFGKRAGKSALILSRLNVGVDEMRGKMAKAEGAAAAMAGVMDDNLEGDWLKFRSAVEGVAIAIGEDLEEPLRSLLVMLTGAATQALEWIKANKGIVVVASAVAAGLIATGGALISLGLAASVASFAIGGLVTMLSAAGTVLGILFSPFVFSPFVLITAAVLSAAAALVYYSGIGGKTISFLSDKFGGLAEIAGEVFGGIKDAMLSGDFEKAGNILWKGLEIAWLTGQNAINSKLSEWKTFFLDIWYGAIDDASGYFIDSWAGIQDAWTTMTQFLGDSWDMVMNKVQKVWSVVGGTIINGIGHMMNTLKVLNPAMASVLPDTGEFRFRAKEFTGAYKTSDEIDSATNASIADRDQRARANRQGIRQGQQGSHETAGEMSQQRQDARQKELEASQKKAADAMAAAQQELKDLLNKESAAAATSSEEKQKQAAAAAAAASSATGPNGAVAKAGKAIGGGSGDLRTKEGIDTLTRLINLNGGEVTAKEQLAQLKKVVSLLQRDNSVEVVRSS
ncbi:phage tail tape measure protein [Gimesia algae]|uniref:phage tail tape measure protein n=1 Tax=Gimesia algae TaxID=2527971 RepID=UPI0018D6097B|nr:phage tail tape measure protein [Gimesia algae]